MRTIKGFIGIPTLIIIILVALVSYLLYNNFQLSKNKVSIQTEDKNVLVDFPISVLKTDYGIEGFKDSYPHSIQIEVPSKYKNDLGAYGVSGNVIIGPKNWTGNGIVAADGSFDVYLYPINGSSDFGERIIYSGIPSCVSCILEGASLYFPDALEEYKKENASTPRPTNIVNIVYLSKNLAKYHFAVNDKDLEGLGVAHYLGVGEFGSVGNPAFGNFQAILQKGKTDFSQSLLDIYIRQISFEGK